MAIFRSGRRAPVRHARAAVLGAATIFAATLAWIAVPSFSSQPADGSHLIQETSSIFSGSSQEQAGDRTSPALSLAVVEERSVPENAWWSSHAGEAAAAAPVSPPPPATTDLRAAPVNAVQRWAAAGIYIETAGQDLDAASLANIDAALSSLPPELLEKLGNPALGPLHILVNTEGRTRSGNQPYRGPANFYSTNEGTNEIVLYPQQSVFTVLHELGHAYNLRNIDAGRYAMVLLDPEMRSFLRAAGWTISSSEAEIRAAVDHMQVAYAYGGSFQWPRLSSNDPLEDFANSFAMYFLDPEGLRKASPERYGWMAGVFGR